MSENNVNGIIGAEVTTTGIIGATVAIGQYIVNDYVITIAPVEDDYGYTMTITRGSDTQTVTLYGLSTEQYNSMLGYLQQAQEAAQSAEGSASDAFEYLARALDAANRATNLALRAEQASDTARSYASQAQTAKQGAETAKTDAQTARTQAQGYWQAAETAATRAGSAATCAETALAAAETAQSAAEAAQTAAEAAETDTQTYAGQASQSAANAAQSAANAAQTLTQVQAEGAVQIAAIDAEGQRVIDSIPEDYSQMEEDVTDLKSQTQDIQNELIGTKSIQTSTHYTLSRYVVSGSSYSLQSSSLYDVVSLIPVNEGDVFSVPYSLTSSSTTFLCYFSNSPESTGNLVDSSNAITAGEKYTVPEHVKYLGLTVPTGTTPIVTFYVDKIDILEEKVSDVADSKSRANTARSTTMDTGDSISISVGNLKKNTVLGFSANITTFGSLQIGQGKTVNGETAYLVINDSTIKVYGYQSGAVERGLYSHGLSISDYIDICVEESNTEIGYAKISITSNGETYTIDRVMWTGYNGTVYADAISGSYANCLLNYYCADYTKDVWMFGDSYFDHWCAHCLKEGHSNFLCDGFSGRKSNEAYTSLERNMLHGKPNTIIWCLGMNNGDTSSAVNSTWYEYYIKLKNMCEDQNINLVLCTIPNVATVNNNYKNAIIRESGYRYIDLAKAVGSDISTAWYTGLLSNDGVHPSALGDEMIARFMESAVPEITK